MLRTWLMLAQQAMVRWPLTSSWFASCMLVIVLLFVAGARP